MGGGAGGAEACGGWPGAPGVEGSTWLKLQLAPLRQVPCMKNLHGGRPSPPPPPLPGGGGGGGGPPAVGCDGTRSWLKRQDAPLRHAPLAKKEHGGAPDVMRCARGEDDYASCTRRGMTRAHTQRATVCVARSPMIDFVASRLCVS